MSKIKTDSDKAFLIIDAQSMCTRNLPRTNRDLQQAAEVAHSSMPVIWTYYTGTAATIAPQPARTGLSQIFNPESPVDFAKNNMLPTISPHDEDWVFNKSVSDAFENKALLPFLQQLGIKELYIAGYMIGVCVEATVKSAIKHGLKTTVLTDLSGHLSDEDADRQSAIEKSLKPIKGLHLARSHEVMSNRH